MEKKPVQLTSNKSLKDSEKAKHPLVKDEIPIIYNRESSIEFLRAFILIDEEKKDLLKHKAKS